MMILIFSLVVILFSAIIHEYMHGWMADRLGDPTAKYSGRLTLNPIPHIDPVFSIIMPVAMYYLSAGTFFFAAAKPVPFNPYNLRDQKYGSAKVALAGPMTNLITAVFFGLLLRFLAESRILVGDGTVYQLLAVIVQVNLVLAIFNSLPIPPLDGSKMIAPFLSYSWQMRFAALESYGFIMVMLFVFFGFQLIIPLIGLLFNTITGIRLY